MEIGRLKIFQNGRFIFWRISQFSVMSSIMVNQSVEKITILQAESFAGY